jgi:hypothetical protein
MDKLDKLKAERQKIDIKIRDIEYKELVEKSIPKLKQSIGKCYKYSNSYGGNTKRWPLYKKIISIDEKTMSFNSIEFQHTSMNIIEIKHNQVFNFNGENHFDSWGNNYTEISNSEFNKAKKSLIKTVNRLLS